MILRNLSKFTNPTYRLFSSKAKSNLKYGITAPRRPYTDIYRSATQNEKNMNYPQNFDSLNLYKNGFVEEDFEGLNPAIKKVFSLENSSPKEIFQFRLKNAIKKF